jgi:outer membrane protein assembly factor BamB
MDGELLKTWTADYPPDSDVVRDRGRRGDKGWANAKFGPDGHLYAIHDGMGLIKLDWDGVMVWGRPEFYHHDLAFAEDGTIIALIDTDRRIEFDGRPLILLDNGFAFVTPDGKIERIIWMYDILAENEHFVRTLGNAGLDRLPGVLDQDLDLENAGAAFGDAAAFFGPDHRRRRRGQDAMHPNAVHILSTASEGRWDAGDLMTSLREMGIVAVFDRGTGALKWSWGYGILDNAHDPSLLPNGHLLVFDNGMYRKQSRVIEVDPATEEIVWQYPADDGQSFYSRVMGLAQPLENGNILVVSSEAGQVFEVSPKREKVWEFFSPVFISPPNRDTLHRVGLRMHRLEGEVLHHLQSRLIEDRSARQPSESAGRR